MSLDSQAGVDIAEGLKKEYEFQLKRKQSGEVDEALATSLTQPG
jgi:hypothetical protein